MRQYGPYLLYIFYLYFCIRMVVITVPYFGMEDTTGFLAIKQHVIGNPVWKTAFYTHVFTSCFLLLAGFTQFSSKILKRNKALHRNIGKAYVIVLLFFSGPSGLIMAIYANGGITSQIGFTLVALLWIFFTIRAWQTALQKDFKAHRAFMIRSFALTCSALTLRAWKVLIAFTVHPPPMDLYRVIAWLGWVPNLIFAEWLIRSSVQRKKMLEI